VFALPVLLHLCSQLLLLCQFLLSLSSSQVPLNSNPIFVSDLDQSPSHAPLPGLKHPASTQLPFDFHSMQYHSTTTFSTHIMNCGPTGIEYPKAHSNIRMVFVTRKIDLAHFSKCSDDELAVRRSKITIPLKPE
jgi:hypothetical protein